MLPLLGSCFSLVRCLGSSLTMLWSRLPLRPTAPSLFTLTRKPAWASICRCGRVPDHVAAADLLKILWDLCAVRSAGGNLPPLELHAVCNHAADRAAKRAARAALTVPSARLDALFSLPTAATFGSKGCSLSCHARPFRPLRLVLLWMLPALPRRAPPLVSCRAMALRRWLLPPLRCLDHWTGSGAQRRGQLGSLFLQRPFGQGSRMNVSLVLRSPLSSCGATLEYCHALLVGLPRGLTC